MPQNSGDAPLAFRTPSDDRDRIKVRDLLLGLLMTVVIWGGIYLLMLGGSFLFGLIGLVLPGLSFGPSN